MSTAQNSEIADDPNNPQPTNNGFLGPSYPYKDNINPPDRVGITSKVGINALTKDGVGLLSYVQVLLEGGGKASMTGQPLGNKFFYYTGGKCKPLTDQSGVIWEQSLDPDIETHKEEDVYRYIFVNNIPTGGLGFGDLSGSSIFRGLIPGTIQDLTAFSRLSIMNAFSGDTTPPCQYVTLKTVDEHNNSSTEGHYIALMDLKNMNDICSGTGKITYATGLESLPLYMCDGNGNKNPDPYAKPLYKPVVRPYIPPTPPSTSGFTNMNISNKLPDNIIDQFFLLCICLIGIYILYRVHKYNK